MKGNQHQNLRLRYVAVKGYKSIKKLDLKMNAVNILIGANGAGIVIGFRFVLAQLLHIGKNNLTLDLKLS